MFDLFVFRLVFVVLLSVAIVFFIIFNAVRMHYIKKFVNSLYVGMSMTTVMDSIGNRRYSRSVLKDGTEKYDFVWTKSSSYSYKGARSYSPSKKTVIYIKNGAVTQFKNYNI